MRRLRLCLAIHNHQPVGNFGEIFEKATRLCYEPFLSALERHPSVRLSLHYTGPLLEWFQRFHPPFLERLRALVERGQVEILGGGFYEPILSVLPERDALAQIARMREFCEAHLGTRPEGIWLAERAWDPDLPRVLSRAGVRFTLLDDTAFLHAGLMPDEISGHFVTEKAGHALSLFPIDRSLRYLIPFREPAEIVVKLRELQQRGVTSVTYGDDGEKLGLWPGTQEWVYGKKWLERFFATLETTRDFLELVHFAEALEDPPAGRVYLPTASYEEMMEWALPARSQALYDDFRHALEGEKRLDAVRPYVRGGIWQGFLAKYPEANALHKRMLLVSERVDRAFRVALAAEARAAVHRGQCNDAYWHGLFGGLYHRHLRSAVYRELLQAETIAERLLPRDRPFRVERRDYDCDGEEEILVSSPILSAIVAPARGGAVVELDHLPRAVNLCDVLSRRIEGYHRKVADARTPGADTGVPRSIHELHLAKEEGLERYLVADRHGRHLFLEHLLPPETTFEDFVGERHRDLVDLATGRWEVAGIHEEGHVSIRLERETGGVSIAKTLVVRVHDRVAATYEIAARGEERPVIFASELSFSLPTEDPSQCYFDLGTERVGLRMPGRLPAAYLLRAVDEHTRLQVSFAASWHAEIWRFPLETVSQSEEGFERNLQGTTVVFLWRGTLRADRPERLELAIEVKALP